MTYRYTCIGGEPILWAKKKQVCVFGTQKLPDALRHRANLLFAPGGCKKGIEE
ncbi:hypothetical protein HH214_18385 [Mucilaginibacter robiniae]|uniref:Uncharacterized protein n=1 Tax=Mucilaginibacter robiniae TaxID=2728022 RepID=A0A7L5E2U7_9SPHI|nr:hypothetical protein [Mucilaginibacter robiniae]QJD97700.1 hypothetical protein HH214_18385 [Mucilaginibacter robiniae]